MALHDHPLWRNMIQEQREANIFSWITSEAIAMRIPRILPDNPEAKSVPGQPGFAAIFRRADDQRDYDLERLNNAVTFVTEAKQLCFEFPEAFRIPIFQLLLKWPFGDC